MDKAVEDLPNFCPLKGNKQTQTNKQTNKQTQTNTHTHKQTNKQTNTHTNKQTNKQTHTPCRQVVDGGQGDL